MGIQIGQKPSPTFQQPLELLSDCHRRIENFLRVLIIVTEQAKGHALDERQRDALQAALRYFREAAPKHTADEEESLFPRMRALGNAAAREALEKIQQLEADHETADHGHALVEEIGSKWLRDNDLDDGDFDALWSTLKTLREIYARHIAIEDQEIFPLAAKTLDAKQIAEVGREMAERRGQKFIAPSRGNDEGATNGK